MTVKDGESFQNIKSNGDKQYSLGNFGEAIQKYSTYIQRNSSAGSIDLALVYSNRCACYLQQGFNIFIATSLFDLLIKFHL